MMATKLSRLDTEALEVVVDKSTRTREGNLPPLTIPQREVASVTTKHLTLPSRTVLIRKENSPNAQITEFLPTHTLSTHNVSDIPLTTDPLPSLHKHWMSAHQQRIFISLIFFGIGFSAITALAIAVIGWLPLDTAAYLLVWPSLVIWLIVGVIYPEYGKLALKGFAIGLLACFFYDGMRFLAIRLGLWGDFIPRIGILLLHTPNPDWAIGYVWRYVGDGGLMSTAFVVGYRVFQPKLDVRIAALLFGVAIWLCLIGTILLAPHGTQMLFPLTPITVSLSLLGHIIYGLSVGFLYTGFFPKTDKAH